MTKTYTKEFPTYSIRFIFTDGILTRGERKEDAGEWREEEITNKKITIGMNWTQEHHDNLVKLGFIYSE